MKSLQGEPLQAVAVRHEGLEGDRRYAIYDVATGLGLTARRMPELLFASSRLARGGTLEITLPDGTVTADDDDLSAWLGRPVELRSSATEAARRYENIDDFEQEPSSSWSVFEGASGAFHDNASARVTLVSTATLGSWDERRFRPNVVVDGDGEDELVGSTVNVGEATLRIGMRVERCVMTTRAQAGGIERDLDVLRTLAREREACLSVGALVTVGGTVRLGDALTAC